MEEVLKGLQGKTLTKKSFFDFLTDINLEDLYGKKEQSIKGEVKGKEDKQIKVQEKVEAQVKTKVEKKVEEKIHIKCTACMKTFATDGSLKRHHERSPVCVNWISLPEKKETVQLTRGLHLIVDDLLEKSMSLDGKLECKFCKSKFINTGNHHKHFNTATICNQLAYQEFKKLFNSL